MKSVPRCLVCGKDGERLYEGLKDRIFGSPGEWSFRRCRRRSCGLVWIDPAPVEADIHKLYGSYYTHSITHTFSHHPPAGAGSRIKKGYLALRYGYGEGRNGDRLLGVLAYLHAPKRADVDYSIGYLPARVGGHLLEVGCGNGDLLRRMRDLGWEAEGVEPDPEAAKQARQGGLKVHCGTVAGRKYPSAEFDAVIMNQVIEHVGDPPALLRECRRILKPGGRLTVVTPNARGLGHRVFGPHWRGLEPPRHLFVFTRGSIRNLAMGAGFRAPMVRTSILDADGMFMASRDIRRKGRHVMGNPQPRSVRLWGRSVQLAEWVIKVAFPWAGEQIVLRARK